jgi:diguanylate cyclase (GGDEF)-like protein
MTFLISLQNLICAYVLFSNQNKKIQVPSRTLSVFFLVIAGQQSYRGISTLMHVNTQVTFFSPSILQSISIFLILLTIVFVSFTVVLMTSLLLEAELKEQSNIDYLTQTHNRRSLDVIASREISKTIRHEKNLAILLCDIDHFKKINDQYGHQIGDNILTVLSTLLKDNVRENDSIARYGGEEFIIFLPETNEIEATILAEKLRNIIDKKHFFISTMKSIHVTLSFGVTGLTKDRPDLKSLIRSADTALYQAKNSGRNQVAVFRESCAI